jgi:hypothetical protein
MGEVDTNLEVTAPFFFKSNPLFKMEVGVRN